MRQFRFRWGVRLAKPDENDSWKKPVKKRSAPAKDFDRQVVRRRRSDGGSLWEEETEVPKGSDGDRYVVKRDDGWAVKKENAERASGVFRTQEEAIDRAREIVNRSSRSDGQVRVQGPDGRFRDSDSGRRNEGPTKERK